MAEEQRNKAHRKSKDGDKKAAPSKGENPKAFTFANPGRSARDAARSHDRREKRLHVPLVDRLPEEAPPLVVAVVGPPGVGKTPLIKSLLRRYTKQTITAPTGPLTVVTSKRRRLTFIECPSDSLAAMIDVAKVVDIVLLMIDGKYGFEMETMEFLNVLAASGMPGNVFGILTKLDLFRKQDALRAQKKRLKHRFWSELHHGAKLFYLSGVVNGRYPDREILNLSRFLSVMKNPRPLIWRNSHPYCLADRYLDITPPTKIELNPKCDRTVALYGYLRGTNFPANGTRVHIPGLGDVSVSDIEALPDPCPTPYMTTAMEKMSGKTKHRRLGEKQKVLFAPMSDVGGVLVDKDAVYIDVKTSTFDPDSGPSEDRGLGEQLVMGLQGDKRLLGDGDGGVRLFGNGSRIDGLQISQEELDDDMPRKRRRAAVDDDDFQLDAQSESDDDSMLQDEAAESDDDDHEDSEEPIRNGHSATFQREQRESEESEKLVFDDSDSDAEDLPEGDLDDEELDGSDADSSGDLDEDDLRWKTDLSAKAKAMFGRKRMGQITNLARFMYDLTLSPLQALQKWRGEETKGELAANGDGDDDDQLFRVKKQDREEDIEDRPIPLYDYEALDQKWQDPENLQTLRSRFTLMRRREGDVDDEYGDDDDGQKDVDDEGGALDSDEGDGEFEDLETGEAQKAKSDGAADATSSLEAEREKNARKKEELRLRFEEEDREGFANDKSNARRDGGTADDMEFGEDDWYKAQKAKIQKQLDINRAEFGEMDELSRVRVEGHRAGTYARLVLTDVPYEFAAHFDPRMPLIVGGLNPTEERFGFVQVRIKRHRWHPKILKTNDPLIFSLGWRRFQSLPIYSISDSRTRNRMLKYTPEHMHCFGTFYGPLIAPNTGFCAVQSLSSKTSGFRVSATGVVLNVDESVQIVKKLKLKGHPHKVYKNTAIIKDMFSSELEVAKFKAANLRTVSGIRGMVKGRAGAQFPEGYVRAGFEDKILMSDIVFLSTWRYVEPREFYAPVTNLLLPRPRRRATLEEDVPEGQLDAAHTDSAAANGAEAGEDDESPVWTGMRLTGAVRAAEGVKVPSRRDSAYAPVAREERRFNPLRVPRKLAAELPFKSQPTRMPGAKKAAYATKRAVVLGGEERRARDLMQMVMTIRNDKTARRREAQERRREPHRRRVAEQLEKKAERERRESREYWRREGRKRATADGGDAGGGGGGKRRRTK